MPPAIRLMLARPLRAARSALARASAIEYGLLAALIAVVTVTALTTVGTKLGRYLGAAPPT